ncbi:protein phosphatase 1, regulatory subunit 3Db isoform X1 [Brienomyrus brachyistius]|uniref:protein phosphatase 1, regulatory subunit 3Db isoform X1 n=2 Tax=Brienomyrus brachyistius TaxID=42636 RepID=UPI0020B40442|nr:protein phosphatase 1, regulatory subunit 3Db isoform X1 [Brienomyrus brachyistius]
MIKTQDLVHEGAVHREKSCCSLPDFCKYLDSQSRCLGPCVSDMERKNSWWQENHLPENAGISLAYAADHSSVTRPPMKIQVKDILGSKVEPQRMSVRIRPPASSTLLTREAFFGQSLSCEPTPKPIIRRRARSLPASSEWKRDPRSQHVRFVDSLGLDLEDIKVFKAGEDPLVPQHVISRLLMSAEMASGKHLEISLPYFKPSFPERMADQPDFLHRLCQQRVCLDEVLCSEMGIIATAQVLNLAFEKEVTAVYSFTNWKSSAISKASWVTTIHRDSAANEPESDIFRFRLPVPPFILQPEAVVEFAICFRAMGAEYWDNNNGINYKLTCHSYKLIVPRECEESMVHFI